MKMLGSTEIECPHCKEIIRLYLSRAETEQEFVQENSGFCVYCELMKPEIHADHIIPQSRQGPNEEWNLVSACDMCNRFKGNKYPWEWLGEDWLPPVGYETQFARAQTFVKGLDEEDLP